MANNEEIRFWGLSGASVSVWASASSFFSFSRVTERGRIPSGLLWTCSGPLLSLFLLLSLLWGSFSGTSPESLLVVWPPPGSSGWLWPPPSSRCRLLRVIRKKSDSGASLELPSPSGPLPHLSFLFHALRREENTDSGLPWTCSGLLLGTSPESLLVFWLRRAGYLGFVSVSEKNMTRNPHPKSVSVR